MKQSRAAGRYSLLFSMIDLKQDGMIINLRLKNHGFENKAIDAILWILVLNLDFWSLLKNTSKSW